MANTIIQFNHVTKRFPGIVANDDITFDVKEGEILAILGENGAGKSVLMSMLFGLYEPDGGEIIVRGEKIDDYSPKEASKRNIGMVHQHFKLVENFTIAENIVLGVEPVKKTLGFLPFVNLDESEKTIRSLSERYRLEVDPKKVIEEVNVATRQRVEILKMLYREADILIFDEPTAILTPQEIDYLLDIIRTLRDSGKTIILITHKLEEIKEVADRCVILNRGKFVDILDVATTSTREMARLMVGRDVILETYKAAPQLSEPVLEVKNLTLHDRDGVKVVDDVSFTIRGGEVFAIAGVSGNGQVEIADAVCGLHPISEGSIALNGEELTNKTIRQRNELGISYIPEDRQAFGLILDFDLGDNLAFKSYYQEPFSKNGILNQPAFDAFANRLIGEYDIRSNRGARSIVRSLSGGNQQKAIIAREIEEDNPLVIFVQPTRGLDVGAIENTWSQILEERDKGKAVLLVSLELEEVKALADTIGVIYSGRLLATESAKDLNTTQIGAYMMGVTQ